MHGNLAAANELIRVCMYCNRTPLGRTNGEERWVALGHVYESPDESLLSHGVCPACYRGIVTPALRVLAGGAREG
jgi:hypothetical protein